MFRCLSYLRARATAAAAAQYLQHLHPRSGATLVPLADLLPSARDGMPEAVAFQRHLLAHIRTTGSASSSSSTSSSDNHHLSRARHSGTATTSGRGSSTDEGIGNAPARCLPANGVDCVAAWHVTPPSAVTLRNMGHREAVITPVLRSQLALWGERRNLSEAGGESDAMTTRDGAPAACAVSVPRKARRVQSVEAQLVAFLDARGAAVTHVAPAIAVYGSRFPFYAPHAPGLAADLGSLVFAHVGRPVPLEAVGSNVAGLGVVLSVGAEPIEVGYCPTGSATDVPTTTAQWVAATHPEWRAPTVEQFFPPAAGAPAPGAAAAAAGVDGAMLTGVDALTGAQMMPTVVFCGAVARAPARQMAQTYRANFGPLGAVDIHLSE